MIRQSVPGCTVEDAPGRFEPVHLRHPDVHQHYVRLVFQDCGHSVRAVGGLSNDGDPGIAQDHAESGADQGLVVGDEDARGGLAGCAVTVAHDGTGIAARDGCSGNWALTRQPPPGWLPASSSPPYSKTRSRRPSRPRPPGIALSAPGAPRWTFANFAWPAVVGDLDHQGVVPVVKGDRRRRLPGVLDHVGERFLDDTVGGQVHARRQCPRRAAYAELDGQPGGGHPLDERAGLVQAGLWPQRPGVLGGAPAGVFRLARLREQAEHVLELGDGRPAAFLDGQQRRPGLVRRGAKYPPGRARLHHHHADVVRHHVVQLAGDARPLLPDGPAGGLSCSSWSRSSRACEPLARCRLRCTAFPTTRTAMNTSTVTSSV